MKRIISITSVLIICTISWLFFRQTKQPNSAATYNIGILQTASHPALDAVCDGFVTELKNRLGEKITFVIQNAQGSVGQSHAIAQQFQANRKLNGFFAIATPAAQALGAVAKEKPIFIAAVTDPVALGLITPTTNVCGTKDMIDVKAEVQMITQLIPQAKTIGLLYTSGETNSTTLAKLMRQELTTVGLTPLDFAVSNEADMPAMVDLACRKADVILAPTDNTVAASIALIVSIANKHQKPLIVSDNMLVRFGALAARGVDYHASGKQTADLAYQVLVDGKKPFELPITQAATSQIYLNKKTLQTLGLAIPKTLEQNIILIEE